MRNDPETGQSGFVMPDDDTPDSDHAIINHMSRAIRDLPDIQHAESRMWAYHRANVSAEQIAEYDRRAIILADAWKATRPKPSIASIAAQVAGTVTIGAIGFWCIGIASLFPEPAQAAASIPPDDFGASFLDAAGYVAALFMFLIGVAMLWTWATTKPSEISYDELERDERTIEQRVRDGGAGA